MWRTASSGGDVALLLCTLFIPVVPNVIKVFAVLKVAMPFDGPFSSRTQLLKKKFEITSYFGIQNASLFLEPGVAAALTSSI